MQAMASLVLKAELGPATGKIFDAAHLTRFTIGRTRGNRFQIKDNAISQKHLLVECRDSEWIVEDLGSSNGTSINGILIQEGVPVPIFHDDLLRIGADTRLRVLLQQESVPVELPKERKDSRRRGSSQVKVSRPECCCEQTPCLEQTSSTVRQSHQSKQSTQLRSFSVLEDIIPTSDLKESSRIRSLSRQKGSEPMQSMLTSSHDVEFTRKKSPPKQKEKAKGSEMTLRQWFAQERERVPQSIREAAEETMRELKEHSERLKEAHLIRLLKSKTLQ